MGLSSVDDISNGMICIGIALRLLELSAVDASV
jgi:hypothetical protein